MSTSTVGKRLLSSTMREYEGRVADVDRLDEYALDPWLHCDEGHVRILDLETQEEVEFRPYEHQREMADAWIDAAHLRATGILRYRNVHEEKSRQMGGTWALAWLVLHALMYHDAAGLVVHLNFTEVDDGGSGSTPDSFFGKIRYMHERLPDRYRQPLIFKLGTIRHAYRSAAYVVAEGATPNPGRGKTYKYVLVDEAAQLPFGEAAHAALSRSCPDGRYYISTPYGTGNMYARLKKERPINFAFLRQHWTRHPFYADGLHVAAAIEKDARGRVRIVEPGDPDCPMCSGVRRGLSWSAQNPVAHRYPGRPTSPWYDRAVLELTNEQVAQELDIDYSGSLTARVYPEFSEEIHVADAPIGWDPEAGPEPEFAFDYGLDYSAVVILQDLPGEVRAIAEVEVEDNATPDVVCEALKAKLAELGFREDLLDDPDFTRRLLAIGDPAGEAKQLSTGRPLIADYYRFGFRIKSRPFPVARTVLALKRLLLGIPKTFIVSPDCPLLIEHFEQNRWQTDRAGNRKTGNLPPQDDRHNHMMRALAYYASVKWPPGSTDDALDKARAEKPTSTTTERPSGNRSGVADRSIRPDMRL